MREMCSGTHGAAHRVGSVRLKLYVPSGMSAVSVLITCLLRCRKFIEVCVMRPLCLLYALHARASRCFPCPDKLSSGQFLLVPA